MVRTGSELEPDLLNWFSKVRSEVQVVLLNRTLEKFEVRKKTSENRTEPNFGSTSQDQGPCLVHPP